MAKCPHCGKEVSYSSVWRGSSPFSREYWRNNFGFLGFKNRFKYVYTCNNCNALFSITIGSQLLEGALALIFLLVVYFGIPVVFFGKPLALRGDDEEFIPAGHNMFVFVLLLVVVLCIYLLCEIWWRYLAKTREPYD